MDSGKNAAQTNAKGDGTMSGNYGGFPWGMASMDIDQDWSWFMNDSQNNPGTNNAPLMGGPVNPDYLNSIHQRFL